ncbi:MAG: IPT/TIG domain-containing protein [Acidobacteria bacterium]|nr:IPT/TIG domain-containing protein [Acidobacteriota bacterium]
MKTAIIRAICVLAVSACAVWGQEPWQSSWDEFIRALDVCLRGPNCDLAPMGNKSVTWQGTYKGPATLRDGTLVQQIQMTPVQQIVPAGLRVPMGDLYRSKANDPEAWKRIPVESLVRFRTVIVPLILDFGNAREIVLFGDPITLVTEPGPPTISSVTEGAGFQPVIAPHGWVVIKGTDLATTSRTWEQRDFNGQALPVSLDGTRVTINGKPAYIYYVSPTQLNVLAPADTAEGPVTVEVTTPRGTGRATARMDRYAPGLFLQDPENRRYVAAAHAAGGIVGKVGLYPSSPSLTRPLLAGGRAQIYGSGWGRTDRTQPEGVLFSGAWSIVGIEHLRVSIGGQPAVVEFAGAVGPGLYQINIIAPASLPSGDHLVQIDFGNYRTQANAYITIQGTAAPSQMSVVPGALTFTHRIGQPQPAPAVLQLTSSTGNLDFTAVREGNPLPNWLSLSATSGRTPASLAVSVNTAGLSAGVYSGSIRITAAGSNAISVPVTLSVTAPPAATPVIDSLTPNNGFPNELLPSFTITGTGLEAVTGIVVEPSAGISVNAVKASATRVTAQLLVAGTAQVNARTVYVVTPTGRSNALPFQILVPSILPSISNVTVQSSASGPGAITTFRFDFTDGDQDILFKGGFGQSAQIEVDFSASQFVYGGCEDIFTGPPLNQPGQMRGSVVLGAEYSHSTKITSTAGIPLLVRLKDSAGNRSAPVRVVVSEYYSVCRALGVRPFVADNPAERIETNSLVFREADGSAGRLSGPGVAGAQVVRPQQ